ncbi:MAG: 50S ribosomal protein L20 [Candidatus Magasanikbacteria bacterium CG10_big_fil_rev_8_21_14_0_10_40_10]|uniref:Large ribosomal subunit protein bL20 n=1 Tax=Candidatus Magasanikbacteria bacterium CG10_big_fil_rev_8_21_14_0_10_40_10 TaxID=1974648 RepID=A0A2M6W4S4_9BACT|nr:MAG: 50S ribosomal protein L20 [Candidatus Magasanikbacteria bacterium CG10_big_fil_rev_8_21_14_0_10_40_10]
MPRVKGGMVHSKRRKNILKLTKGYKWGRSTKIKSAKMAAKKAGQHAYNDRRKKKRNFRGLWLIRINAAVREHGLSYSRFIDALKKKNITLNRRVLSEIAGDQPKIFAQIVAMAK